MKAGVLTGKPSFNEKIFVTKTTLPSFKEITPSFRKIFESKWVTNNGPFVQNFEKQLARFIGVKHCAVFSNGTQALELLIRTLNLKGEIITTPFTFPATVHAIKANNLSPVFCDIDPENYNIDETKLSKLITKKTSAILAVNVFGNPSNIEALEKTAKKNKLKLIFDSAHAFGCSYKGKRIGCFGNAEMFSFHAAKLFTTIEGGAVTTNDSRLYKKLCLLRNFGIVNEEKTACWGTNAKMNELAAAIGLGNLKKIKSKIKKLRKWNAVYKKQLKTIPGLKFQKINKKAKINHQYFAIEVNPKEFGLSRDQLHKALKFDNVIARKYFYPGCNKIPDYKKIPSSSPKNLPITERISKQILCLPVYPELSVESVKKVCNVIKSIHLDSERVAKKVK